MKQGWVRPVKCEAWGSRRGQAGLAPRGALTASWEPPRCRAFPRHPRGPGRRGSWAASTCQTGTGPRALGEGATGSCAPSQGTGSLPDRAARRGGVSGEVACDLSLMVGRDGRAPTPEAGTSGTASVRWQGGGGRGDGGAVLHVRPFGACVADQAAGWPCGALRGGGARERPVGSVSGATLLGAGGPAGLPEEDGGGGRDRGLRGGGPHMGSTAEAERGGRRDPGGCGEKRRGRHWARPGGRSWGRAGVDVFLQGRAGVDAFLQG